jgi:hypothetical protein
MTESLFRHSGGRAKSSTAHEPNEREGFALAVGAAMQWGKLRDASNKMFFPAIAEEVKRCGGTERSWTKDEMTYFVMQKLFGGIPMYAVEKWIQGEFLDKRGSAQLEAGRKALVENFLYKYLSQCPSGADYTAASELAERACLNSVLRCTALGGKPDWSVSDFLSEDAWDELGGKAGLKKQSIKLMTIIAERSLQAKPGPVPVRPIGSRRR